MAEVDATLTLDHWLWRSGWRPGRRFYTWHVTEFVTEPAISEIVDSYAPSLTATGVLDLVPAQWLHLTMQGIGFADVVSESDARAIVTAARFLLADVEPVVATLGPIDMDAEAAFLPFRPVGPLEAVRSRLRSAVAEVCGAEQVPESAQFGWPPHISLGYMNTAGEPLAPIRGRVRQDIRTWEVAVPTVSLIELGRDDNLYRWTIVDRPVHLGNPSR